MGSAQSTEEPRTVKVTREEAEEAYNVVNVSTEMISRLKEQQDEQSRQRGSSSDQGYKSEYATTGTQDTATSGDEEAVK